MSDVNELNYASLLQETAAEINNITGKTVSARGTRKEETEYLESLISNPRRSSSNRDDEMDEGEVRKDCLRMYTNLCVRLRLPCMPELKADQRLVSNTPKKSHKSQESLSRAPALRTWDASPARIKAISQALVQTLRMKKEEPVVKTTWRDKFDEEGNPKGIPWWQIGESQ
ncbi:hypothetical protein GUITHDRAFT_155703 [Guillardia theta CCMP2712]|uniref:Uncharacterized protein n=1 Tax=Guillardia theta (strain CCMP2712) TaxID=905079 RepID=L1IEU2_GUITC|nr:hypothetical protein GUITHDRAFT_155703 [Guillardia theta CCMP2712]EKX34612.1 hypothetical protein GUITHDRAFT_155703 [Guillardia theta CCMP2712]|mmetsp:Transcript_38548/g.121490  ORF Transcript_38548/g.121490 Transcript_38548/m.121490 type:complete len:171 (-) Transcript_38548:181-693(-)|eukprot:XP_005821592.1 hypothetical protein GUITHDRAFT_155703 [Guillardia theta CCMP2712]